MPIYKFGYLIPYAVLLALSCTSQAATPLVQEILSKTADIDYGEYLASECAGCHNPHGDGESPVPVIHGVQAERIVEALVAYRSGQRINNSMQDVAGSLGDDEIAALAAYLSAVQ
jgi:cytochrome c